MRTDTVSVARMPIAMNDVATIERRVRRGSGALPAGLFGGVIFGLFGAALSGLCEFDCDYAWVLPTAAGATMGFALGSVAGAVISPGRAHWQPLHPPVDSLQVQRIVTEDPQPYAGGGVTFSVGTGWSIEEHRYRIWRLGLQLSGTNRAERPVETTGEFQLIGAPDGGGAAFYTGAGANVILPSGVYAGPVVGFMFVDDAMPSVGARVGVRPRRSGVRPELRADYVIDDSQALLLTLSFGFEVH